jgi:hypothetical protein
VRRTQPRAGISSPNVPATLNSHDDEKSSLTEIPIKSKNPEVDVIGSSSGRNCYRRAGEPACGQQLVLPESIAPNMAIPVTSPQPGIMSHCG